MRTIDATKRANLTAWGRLLTMVGGAVGAVATSLGDRRQWRSDRGPYRHPNLDELE